MSDVAYGQRDIKSIKKRERANFLFRALRKVLRTLLQTKNRSVKTLSTYPAIDNQSELIEVANKLAWAFPAKEHLKIYVLVSETLKDFDLGNVSTVPNMRNYLKTDLAHMGLVSDLRDTDLLFYIKAKALLKANPMQLYKIEVMDKNYFSATEGQVLQFGFAKTLTVVERKKTEDLSKENFDRFLKKNKHKLKSYCFVTGPSFDRYREFDYEAGALKVICNSTVKNDDFLEYIGAPDLLVFADPVFHFSPSEYAAVFRDEVMKVYNKYKPFIAVPFDTVDLLLAHYPMLKDRIIGVKDHPDAFNFPTAENLWVKSSQNILTLFMLPIASAVSRDIDILGADGRKPDEKYFWKHSKSAQFDDLMQTVFETHPSFFRDRDYKDYYEEHCVFLEKLIRYGEERGKHYYSLTPSYIPALKERMK